MRIVQYERRGTVGCGVEAGGQIHPTGYPDTLSLIRDGERGLEAAAAAAEGSEPVAVDRILAPLTNPGKIFGSGVNYASHGDEEPGFVFPDEKVVIGFIKLASAIVGPDAEIVIPPYDDVIRRVPGEGRAAARTRIRRRLRGRAGRGPRGRSKERPRTRRRSTTSLATR